MASSALMTEFIASVVVITLTIGVVGYACYYMYKKSKKEDGQTE